MITLGINAAFHDSAAALVVDGEVLAAAEEERFTRIKHGKRPRAVHRLGAAVPRDRLLPRRRPAIALAEVDHVAYSYDPQRFLRDRARRRTHQPAAASRRRTRRASWENAWDPLFAAYIVNAPRQLADGAPHHLQRALRRRAARRPVPLPFRRPPPVRTRPAPSWPRRSSAARC